MVSHGQQVKKTIILDAEDIKGVVKDALEKECDIGAHYCTLHHKKFMLDR